MAKVSETGGVAEWLRREGEREYVCLSLGVAAVVLGEELTKAAAAAAAAERDKWNPYS